MNQLLIYPIALPIVAGVICLLLPRRAARVCQAVALLTALATLVVAAFIFPQPDLRLALSWMAFGPQLMIPFDLTATFFARLILVAQSAFALLVIAYSIAYMQDHPRQGQYFASLLGALGMTAGAVLAGNLVVLLFFWECVGILLYLAITVTGMTAITSATKSLIIAGFGDLSLFLGIALLWVQTGTLSLADLKAHPLPVDTWLSAAIFLLMLAGAFAKSGVMPLHSWIPAVSTDTLPPVMSYFTSVDKMVGIYLLARLALDLFVMTPAMSLVLLAAGAASLLGGVMMAMIQHDYRRMLAFHNVSQVGYVVLGIGTGTPLGIIGGLFHMFNMVVLKGNLFLCGGAMQHQTGRTEFAELGGLAKAMPWTFVCTLIASLGIAGVPPLNAFVSKWLIYQGIIDRGGPLFPILLVVAMFGSALTLASFMKLMYSMFWGDRPADLGNVAEASRWMRVPMVVLALAAIGLGVVYVWPVQNLLVPAVSASGLDVPIPGLWDSSLAAVLLIVSLLAGLVIYLAGRPLGVKETDVFLGGELMDSERYRVPGTHMYGPIKELNGLRQLLALGERGAFDIYNYGLSLLRWLGRIAYDDVELTLTDLYEDTLPALMQVVGQVLRQLNRRLVLTHALWVIYAVCAVVAFAAPGESGIVGLVRVVACIGMIGWALLALVEDDLMRLLVMGATSQAGVVVLGLTLSRGATVSYLFANGLAFVVLYYCASAFSQAARTSALDAMKGLAGRMPVRCYVFVVATFWLAGLPPFGTFFSKYVLGTAAEEISVSFSIAITATAILTLGYCLRPVRRLLMTGSPRDASVS